MPTVTGPALCYFGPDVTSATGGVTIFPMKRILPPRQSVWLFVAGLLLLMAAGVASMSKFGPPRGHVYAALQPKR